jgi:hypothetical protein
MPFLRLSVTLMVLAAVALGVWAVVANNDHSTASDRPTASDVEKILGDADAAAGTHVTVAGDVKVLLKPWAVLLGSSDAAQTGLIVVANGRVPDAIRTNQRVTVSGKVARFSLQQFRRTHPEATNRRIGQSPLRYLDGHPAIVSATISASAP